MIIIDDFLNFLYALIYLKLECFTSTAKLHEKNIHLYEMQMK